LVSIPVIMFGSRFILAMMNRYPIIVTGGGLLLGWIAGVMPLMATQTPPPMATSNSPTLTVLR
jgi:predicted tellurium resistance membrane protein TerC